MKATNKNSIAEGYFHRYRILCVWHIGSSTDIDSHHKHGAARCRTEDIAKHLRKVHKYKQHIIISK